MEIDKVSPLKPVVEVTKKNDPMEKFNSITDEDWVENLIKGYMNVTIDVCFY